MSRGKWNKPCKEVKVCIFSAISTFGPKSFTPEDDGRIWSHHLLFELDSCQVYASYRLKRDDKWDASVSQNKKAHARLRWKINAVKSDCFTELSRCPSHWVSPLLCVIQEEKKDSLLCAAWEYNSLSDISSAVSNFTVIWTFFDHTYAFQFPNQRPTDPGELHCFSLSF